MATIEEQKKRMESLVNPLGFNTIQQIIQQANAQSTGVAAALAAMGSSADILDQLKKGKE